MIEDPHDPNIPILYYTLSTAVIIQVRPKAPPSTNFFVSLLTSPRAWSPAEGLLEAASMNVSMASPKSHASMSQPRRPCMCLHVKLLHVHTSYFGSLRCQRGLVWILADLVLQACSRGLNNYAYSGPLIPSIATVPDTSNIHPNDIYHYLNQCFC